MTIHHSTYTTRSRKILQPRRIQEPQGHRLRLPVLVSYVEFKICDIGIDHVCHVGNQLKLVSQKLTSW